MNALLPIAASEATRARWQRRVRPLEQADLGGDMLLVHEIYSSIQGEGSHAGLPCSFVRLTACHLRCSYCDTRQAFGHGSPMQLGDVVQQVRALGPKLCLITGGEPMLQRQVLPLMQQLCEAGITVLLETSGSVSLHEVDPRVICIVDMKTPSSLEVAANDYTLLARLRPHDEVKFVIGSHEDYLWAKSILIDHNLLGRDGILFGPVFGKLDPKDLVQWVLADNLSVRVQVQLHKYIWDAKTQGV